MASSSITQTICSTVLGKRKASRHVLHLSSSPEPSISGYTDSDCEATTSKALCSSQAPVIIVNGALVPKTKKRYQCTLEGCGKSYKKPSRLAEHERSHTGERPYICTTCQKSYLRETHLQAHSRCHLPETSKPLVCTEPNCGRRFWTSQHLRVHGATHNGEKPFQCTVDTCTESFAKHHQLRAHLCDAHAAPGTKAYQCYHGSCPKTFTTNQHLRAHMNTHDEKRYTCVRTECMSEDGSPVNYFSNWTSLQYHIRSVHPPTCDRPACSGRTFTTQKGLRGHQKLHEQRDMENAMEDAMSESDNDQRPRKKRRGGEVGRDWACQVGGCGKAFKSKKSLSTHHKISHIGKREFVCPNEDCKFAFGYKHLLQRHLATIHSPDRAKSRTESQDTSGPKGSSTNVDDITGRTYDLTAAQKVAKGKHLRCPYPSVESFELEESVVGETPNASSCSYVFSRAYDLRRHLKSVHGVSAVKQSLDAWVSEQKSL